MQKAQTVTQRRDIHGAGSKSKIPTEEEVDLRREKVSLKSGMKRCNGGRSAESERKRIPDTWSSKEKRSTSLGRFKERYSGQMLVRRAKRMKGRVGNEKIAKIRRLISL